MSTRSLRDTLDSILPDRRVFTDLRQAIDAQIARGGFSAEEVARLSALDGVGEIVNKRFIATRFDVGFGTHYVCRVAIGGVASQRAGIVRARLFMAELFYTDDLRLITVDYADDADADDE